jgi:hypothetical protein
MSSARLSRFVWIGLNWIGWTQVTDQARTISSCTIDRDRIETISSMISQSQRTRQTKSKQITNASKKQHPGRAAAVARIVLVVLIELQSLLLAVVSSNSSGDLGVWCVVSVSSWRSTTTELFGKIGSRIVDFSFQSRSRKRFVFEKCSGRGRTDLDHR